MFHLHVSYLQLLMEAGQDLDLSIGDVVDGVVQRAKGGSVKQSKQMDALRKLMQTADDMLEAVRGKSVIEVHVYTVEVMEKFLFRSRSNDSCSIIEIHYRMCRQCVPGLPLKFRDGLGTRLGCTKH